ncbi:MAG: cell division protein FtsA [Bacteroidales bacterium]|nr:cell division protein FtsA [Bacteroidales bacterium]
METKDRYIVAVDLGTSKIALTVARIEGENTQIVYYKETPSEGIRNSGVFNASQVSEPLTEAIHQAENALGIKITQAVVGMPKYPVRQEANTGKIEGRGYDEDITAEDIAELKRAAQDMYPLENPNMEAIYGAVAQSFSDGENFQIIESDIIGMTSDILEGNFKIFIGKKSSLAKIDTVFKKSGIVTARKYFTADTTAKAVLLDSEMENGVAMIDFGGGCVSVSVYHGNIMRHYASIPFGGKNITGDIQIESEGSISRELAENIKIAFGACMPEKLQNLSEKIIHIKSDNGEAEKKLPVKYLSEIISARVEEIIMAILYEIQESGFADRLMSGIVVTGGCAQTANLGNLIYDLSGYRVRTGYPKHVFSFEGCEGITDTSASTSIGLVMAAKEDHTINCAVAKDGYVPETITESVEEKAEEPVKDTLLQFETVEPVKQTTRPAAKTPSDKKKNNGEKVKWNIRGLFETLYDSVHNELDEIDKEQA